MQLLNNQQAFMEGYHTRAIKGASNSELLKYNAYLIGQKFAIDAAIYFIQKNKQVGYSALGVEARREYESYCKVQDEIDRSALDVLGSEPAIPLEDWTRDEWWSEAA